MRWSISGCAPGLPEIREEEVPEEAIPLRMEIDSFFSFVRENYAKGDSYLHQPILSGPMQESKIHPLVGNGWKHLIHTLKTKSSKLTIRRSSDGYQNQKPFNKYRSMNCSMCFV